MGRGILRKYNPIDHFLVFFKNLKFRKKLFISYITVIIIPIIILGIYSYEQAKTFLLNEAKQGLSESVGQIAENINSKFKRYNSIIYFVIYNQQVVQIVNNEDYNYFQEYVNYTEILDPIFMTILNLDNDMESIVIYTSNKNITERSNSIQLLDRIKDNSWFQSVSSDHLVHWVFDNNALLGLARFYEPFRGAPLNILYTKMKYGQVFDIDMKSVRQYNLYISDASNNTIFSEINIDDSKFKGVEELLPGSAAGDVKINGTRYILIKKQINETGWTLSCLCPVDTIAINANKIVEAMVIIILACLITLIFITWIFSNTFVKRIINLNNKMKLAEDGDLKLQIASSSKDEIGDLTNRFGTMLKNINTLIDEVYHSKIIQKEAEMKALQAQINPHFLYNTLSLINWKAIQIDAMEISQITRNVSKFYRTILNKGKDIISIQDEVTSTKCYIDIQLALHNYSFEVEYNLDEAIYKYDMIKIILQPIVENAIEHGIDMLPEKNGKLTVSGLFREDCIQFGIEDTGPGMEPDKLGRIFLQDSGGYGLKNVQERLTIFFGAEYGIKVTSEIGKGTSILVTIPHYRA